MIRNRLFCNRILFYLIIVNWTSATEINCRGPKIIAWSVKDFKINITWSQRKCANANTTYEVQTCWNKCKLHKRWVTRTNCIVSKIKDRFQCTANENFFHTSATTKSYGGGDPIPLRKALGRDFYRLCPLYSSMPPKDTLCTRFPHPLAKINISNESTFSKPIITLADAHSTWIKVNIKEATDEFLCHYKNLVYSVELWNKRVCDTFPSIRESPLRKTRANIPDTLSENPCIETKNIFIWSVDDLNHDTEYCITASYDSNITMDNSNYKGPSDVGILRIKTKPPENKKLVEISASIFILLLAIFSSIACFVYIRIKRVMAKVKELPTNFVEILTQNDSEVAWFTSYQSLIEIDPLQLESFGLLPNRDVNIPVANNNKETTTHAQDCFDDDKWPASLPNLFPGEYISAEDIGLP